MYLLCIIMYTFFVFSEIKSSYHPILFRINISQIYFNFSLIAFLWLKLSEFSINSCNFEKAFIEKILHVSPMLVHVWSITELSSILCDPMDCSPPGSSVHGIFLERILEWLAIFLHGIFLTQCSNPCLLCLLHCRWILYCWSTWQAIKNAQCSPNLPESSSI